MLTVTIAHYKDLRTGIETIKVNDKIVFEGDWDSQPLKAVEALKKSFEVLNITFEYKYTTSATSREDDEAYKEAKNISWILDEVELEDEE
jgi:hypothetical protein